MLKEKNTLVEPTPEQNNPYLADPRDFVVVEDGVPFHGDCGDDKAQYRRLLQQEKAAANASNFTEEGEEHPDVNRATKPRTP